jgi:hypothetical protein
MMKSSAALLTNQTLFRTPKMRKQWSKFDYPERILTPDLPIPVTERLNEAYKESVEWDYIVTIHLQAYESQRLKRATDDVRKFLLDTVHEIASKQKNYIESTYTNKLLEKIPVPAEVADVPGIQEYMMAEAKKIVHQLKETIFDVTTSFDPNQSQPFEVTEQKWTIVSSKFKYGRAKNKIAEMVYHTFNTVRLPIRDDDFERQIAAIPYWLPIGVQVSLLTHRTENMTYQPILRETTDVHNGRSLMERYFPPEFVESEVENTESPITYTGRPRSNPKTKSAKPKKKR